MPSLSEAWASAYFQLLFGLFVFSLGVPTLLLQLVDEDIRWVVHKRMKQRAWIGVTCLLFAPSLLFIWWLHPSASNVPPLSDWKVILAQLIITGVPLTLAMLGPSVLARITREGLICQLGKEADNEFKQYQARDEQNDSLIQVVKRAGSFLASLLPFHSHPPEPAERRYNSVENESLADLIHLGKYGKPGREKHLVLKSLTKHVTTIHANKNYDGDELEAVIRGLSAILGEDGPVGNDENFATAAALLTGIRDGCFNGDRELGISADAGLLRQAIIKLGTQATRQCSEETVQYFLDLAECYHSQTVFELGVASLATRRYHLTVKALRILQRMTREEDQSTAPTEEKQSQFHLLGLIAHLMASGGAGRQLADDALAKLKMELSVSLVELLDQTTKYYFYTARFDTCDNLAAIRLSLLARVTPLAAHETASLASQVSTPQDEQPV
jgi:hypothetical protein